MTPPLGTARIIQGDATHLPLDDESVDLVVTSPPYRLPGTWSDDPRHAPNHRSSTAEQPPTDPRGPEVPTDPPDGL